MGRTAVQPSASRSARTAWRRVEPARTSTRITGRLRRNLVAGRVEHGRLGALDVELDQVPAGEERGGPGGGHAHRGGRGAVADLLGALAQEGAGGRGLVGLLVGEGELDLGGAVGADHGGLHDLDVVEPVELEVVPGDGGRLGRGLDGGVPPGAGPAPDDRVVTDVRADLEHVARPGAQPPPALRLGLLVAGLAVPPEHPLEPRSRDDQPLAGAAGHLDPLGVDRAVVEQGGRHPPPG